MMNKQMAFFKSGLGLALCFLLVGSGYSSPVHASESGVAINQQARKVTGKVTDTRGGNPFRCKRGGSGYNQWYHYRSGR